MNGRRGFIKGFGLFGAMVTGAIASNGPREVNVSKSSGNIPDGDSVPVLNTPSGGVEDISKYAPPPNANSLQICGSYGPPPSHPVAIPPNSFYIQSSPGPSTHSVNMTVGLDNRLWIKVGEQWKRVALEG